MKTPVRLAADPSVSDTGSAAPRGRLPKPTGALLGRDRLVARILHELFEKDVRLLTLTGFGGSGKTRTAIEAARRAAERFGIDATFVDLSAVRRASQVPDEIARQLGIAALPSSAPWERLAAVIGRSPRLIVVDNAEQVLEAAPGFRVLLDLCDDLRLVVTSRRRLRLAAEYVVSVPPLRLPQPDATTAELAASPAIALFGERARAANAQFSMEGTDALEAVAAVCRQLDGIPLAIELAAARSGVLTPQALQLRLLNADEPYWRLLDSMSSDANHRHGGLRRAIMWSVEQLEPSQLILLRRLAVFASTWTPEAAEAICADRDECGLPSGEVLDALAGLVDLRLVEPAAPAAGSLRFSYLTTIRRIAESLLDRSGERDEVEHRHRRYVAEMLDEAGRTIESAQESLWFERLDAEAAEISTFFEDRGADHKPADMLRAAVALAPYWLNRGQSPAAPLLLSGDGDEQEPIPDGLRAAAHGWALRLSLDSRAASIRADDMQPLIADLASARAVLAHSGDHREWLRASDHLSYALRLRGDAAAARTVALEAVDACADNQDWWRSELLLRVALCEEQCGRADAAVETARQVVRFGAISGNRRAVARARQLIATSDNALTPSHVEAELRAVLDLSECVGDRRGAATSMCLLGHLSYARGDLSGTCTWLSRAIAISRQIAYQHGEGFAIASVLGFAADRNEWTVSARLHGMLSTQLPRLLEHTKPAIKTSYDEAITALRASVGATAFDSVVRRGARLTWDDGSDEAIKALARWSQEGSAGVPIQQQPVSADVLSAREREVLVLVVRGFTNKQIASELHVSAKTVMHHTGHIYRKLQIRGRAHAVAWAVSHGIVNEPTDR